MYKVNVTIEGTTALLQHAFTKNHLATLMEGAKRQTGATDYSLEWMTTMHLTRDNYLCQPASHIEGAMVKAAALFKIKGAKGKTWKDAIRAYCYVAPDEVLHMRNDEYVPAPGVDLTDSPTEHLSVSVMRVVVQRSAVARARLMIAPGWQLPFTLEVHDDQVRPDIAQEILAEAGRAVGIGDFRPRYGRFVVSRFSIQ